jgi:hypothetical protein
VANKRISALTEELTPATSDVVPIDGATTRKTTIVNLVDAARPFASQAEAEAGSGTTQTMNPLASKQLIDYERTQARSFTAAQTFTTASSATTVVKLESTSADASGGPQLDFVRNSASPAANDIVGLIRVRGMNSAASEVTYANINTTILDPTNGSEDARIILQVPVAGVQTSAVSIANGMIVGAPTGSYQGTGTVNSTGYYLNGSALNSGLFGVTPGATGLAILADTTGAAVRTEIGAAAIAANTFTAAQTVTPVALTDGATITPDLTLSNHFTLTLGGNRAMANPSSKTVGTSFLIVIAQDATGSRTLTWGTDYEFPGGIAPTLTTTASGVDMVSGYVYSSTRILCNIVKAFA